ncbi:MAG: hypothetical protein ABFS37_05855 [Acidobacteriota bacterium]
MMAKVEFWQFAGNKQRAILEDGLDSGFRLFLRNCLRRLLVPGIGLGLMVGCGYIFPSKGYFDTLAAVEVVLDGSETAYTIEWENPYEGAYTIGIRVTDPPPQGRQFKTVLETRLTMSVAGNTTWTTKGNVTDWPFWGKGEYPGGFSLLYFEVPEEAPLDQRIRCVLQIEEGDPNFHSEYGDAEWFVRKASEK